MQKLLCTKLVSITYQPHQPCVFNFTENSESVLRSMRKEAAEVIDFATGRLDLLWWKLFMWRRYPQRVLLVLFHQLKTAWHH